jgi:hypothetical protein
MAGIKMEMDVKMEMGLQSETKTEMNDSKQESMELVRERNKIKKFPILTYITVLLKLIILNLF